MRQHYLINNMAREIQKRCLVPFELAMKQTHDEALYLQLRRLYVETYGAFNEQTNKLIGITRPARENSCYNSIFSHIQINEILTTLNKGGGYASILPSLQVNYQDAINYLDFSEKHGDNPNARVFASDIKELLSIKSIKYIINDTGIKYIADKYLGCNTYINMVSAWKTKGVERSISLLSKDAMLFHFDCDHNRFLKVFIYLDDVNRFNGPHSFVRSTGGTNRGMLPSSLNFDKRFSSLEIVKAGLLPEYICGRAGTVIFADTHNFHKGTPVGLGKSRYILQFQFVDSLFGAKQSMPTDLINDLNCEAL